MTPARRAALLRLLEDLEAGRMTDTHTRIGRSELPPDERLALMREQFIAVGLPGRFTLTPAGLAAARQAKEDAHE